MTLPQLNELLEYWKDHPPVHELVAGYLGYKRRPEAKYLPCTRISPVQGMEVGPVIAPAPAANDLSGLVALAARRGGNLRLEDLVG
jgi:hypothetical protein